jgi:hypothetical protein
MPIENLKDLKKHFSSIVFVSYLTVQPSKDLLNEYICKMKEELEDETTKLWYLGRMSENIEKELLSDNVSVFNSITNLSNAI